MKLRKVLSSVMAISMAVALLPAFVGQAKALDASCPSLTAGDEIKVTGKPAIYVLDVNMRYRYFFSGDVYKTYKQNYTGYKEISQACFNSLSASQFPASINPRPGSRVMRNVSTDDLYVGLPGGIQKISDSAARVLYGSDYASNILPVSVVEWPSLSEHIRSGMITSAMIHPGMVFRVSSNTSKIWYMSYMNKIHEISPNALDTNFLNGAVAKNGKIVRSNIYTVPDSAIVGIPTGDPILTPVAFLTDRTYAGYDANGNWTQPVAGTGTGTTTTVPGGNLTVSLANANPNTNQATLVPAGLNTLIKVMDVNFAAGNNDVNVTSINLHRLGITSDSDVQNVYLMNGNVVLTNNLGITNGMVNFSNPSGLFKVTANTTKKITIGVTLSSSASTRSVGFSIDNAAAIVADNNSTVGGTFPVTSAMYTAANVSATAGGIQITNSSPASLSVNAGQTNFEVGRFTVQGQNQLTRIDSMAFTVIGSTSAGDLTNIKLMNGTQQVGFASSTVGNRIVFDLTNNPLQLSAGTTVLLSVQADVVGGVNRTFQLSLQRSYDVVGEDMVFNTLLLPTLAGGNFPMLLSNITVNAGTLVVNRASSSPSVNVLPGGTNQTLASFTAQANGENVQLTNVNVDLTGSMGQSYVTNLKLVDDQGQQIGNPVPSLSGTLNGTVNELQVTGFNYTIPANTTRVLMVKADISNSATGTIQATLTGMSGQGRTSLSNFTVGNQAGNLLTANNNILTVSLNNQMSNTSVVAGQQNVRIGSFSLQAGGSSNVAVSSISLTTNTGVVNVFDNLRVVYNSNSNTAACAPGNGIQIGQTFPTVVDNQSYTFSLGSTLNIPSSSSTNIDVCANVRTGATFASAYAVKINAAGISATASATNQPIANTPAAQVNGQTIATTGPGTLTYFLSGGNPAGAQVGMGTQNVKLASYRLQASNNEDLYVNTVTVVATSTIAEAFGNFRLMVGGTSYGNGSFSGTVSPFTITWSGVRDSGMNSLVVPAGKSVDIDIIADGNTWSAPGNLLNNTFFTTGPSTSFSVSTTLRMSKVEFQGVNSSVAASTTSMTAGNTFTLLRSTLRGAFANTETVTGGYSTQSVVGAIAFTAGANDPAYLYSLTLNESNGGSTIAASTTYVEVLDKQTGQVVGSGYLGSATATATPTVIVLNATGTVAYTGGPNGTAGVTVSPGQTRVFLIRANISASYLPIANSTMNWQVTLSNWAWSDGERDQVLYPLAADPSYTLPIVVSPTNLRW